MPMVAIGKVDVPAQYVPTILAASAKYGVPADFLAAQIEAESGFNPNAVSPAGAIGIAQFMPATADSNGVDPRNPTSAINGMARLMAGYKKEFGSWEKALYAYHDGPGKVDNPGNLARDYAEKVLRKAGSILPGVGPVTDYVGSVANPFKMTETLFGRFSDPAAWKRVGLFAAGGLLGLLGMLILVWSVGGDQIKRLAK